MSRCCAEGCDLVVELWNIYKIHERINLQLKPQYAINCIKLLLIRILQILYLIVTIPSVTAPTIPNQ